MTICDAYSGYCPPFPSPVPSTSPPARSPVLPHTGTVVDLGVLVVLALLLILLGTAIVARARRPR